MEDRLQSQATTEPPPVRQSRRFSCDDFLDRRKPTKPPAPAEVKAAGETTAGSVAIVERAPVLLEAAQALALVVVAVCTHLQVDQKLLLAKGPAVLDVITARQMVVHLLHKLFKLSFQTVGELIERTERIVMGLWEKVGQRSKDSSFFAQDLLILEQALGLISERVVIVSPLAPAEPEPTEEKPKDGGVDEEVEINDPSSANPEPEAAPKDSEGDRASLEEVAPGVEGAVEQRQGEEVVPSILLPTPPSVEAPPASVATPPITKVSLADRTAELMSRALKSALQRPSSSKK